MGEKGEEQKMGTPKRKFPGFRKNMSDYVREFTDNTGIHGLKYIGEQNRTMCEKIWWVILFCISLYVCVDLIVKTWIKWDRSPVLVTFSAAPTPIWQVPFPAISICPLSKIKSTVYNFTDAYRRLKDNRDNLTPQEKKLFFDSMLLCEEFSAERDRFTDTETVDYLMRIAPQFRDILLDCTVINKKCKNNFTPMLTEEGLCFTYNMLDRRELFREKVYLHSNYTTHEYKSEGWTIDGGYPKNAKIHTVPSRVIYTGYSAALHLVLTAFVPDMDYICKGPAQGFEILLHHPGEVPRGRLTYFRAALNKEIVVSIKPDLMTTSEGLREYDPHRRQCYFSSERYSSFYKNYTQQNCQVECLTNYTLSKCDCVAYHMPHVKDTPICGSGSWICMFEAKTELLIRKVSAENSNFEEDRSKKTNGDDCNCLPGCTSLTYNAELSESEFEWGKLIQSHGYRLSDYSGLQMSRLIIYFKDEQFMQLERNELYGQIDFVANCGGILGLFTGFSFLSIVEIVYFLSLRLICNVKHYGRHYWSGSSRLVDNPTFVHTKQ